MQHFLLFISLYALFMGSAQAAQSPTPTQESDLEFLKRLVSISSGTSDLAGVNGVQDAVALKLKEIGFTVKQFENPDTNQKSGRMLVGEFGAGPKYITLVTHADTVFEKVNLFSITQDGKTAMGSGVIDNKGGIVVGLAALREYAKEKKHYYSLRLVVSPSEETGSRGFASIFKTLSEESIFLIGLEPALDNGSYVSSRKGVRWYDVHVNGKESHAGAHHEQGINACDELAIKISKLQALTNYKKGNTVSVGRMEGGKDKFNIVCGSAEAKIDTRFATLTTAKELFSKIELVLKTAYVHSAETGEKTETHFETPVDTAPLPETAQAKKIMSEYVQIVKAIEGHAIHGESTGGVADLNQMVTKDSVIADGMGPIGGGVHTKEEFLTVSTLKTRAQALAEFLKLIDQKLKPAVE